MGAGACFSEQNDSEPHRRLQDPSVGLRAGTGPPGQGVQSPISQTRSGLSDQLPGVVWDVLL